MAILISGNHKVKLPSLPQNSKAILPVKRAACFVELMGRSNFSFLQGASSPEEMVQEAIKHGYDGLGICDLNGLYGVARGFQTTQSPSLFAASLKAKEGFHYLIGSELTLTDETAVTLIPMNKQGYSHLCELLTLGKRQAAKGFSKLSLEQIEKYNQGLLCLALPPWTDKRYERLEKIFDDRLYLPVWRDLTWESHEFCKDAFELEEKYQARLFVTQRPFMHAPERKELFDVITCILHHTTLQEAKNKLIQNGERCLKSIEDLSFLWQDRLDLVEKTVEIAGRVTFSLDEIRYRYPNSNLPAGLTPSEHLRDLAWQGARGRYPDGVPEKIRHMINYELELIKELQYEDYFLTLKEICDFAASKNILYQGRGSAANSVVCYCIGLTSVDPTKVDLLFERFISRERREPPDIDIDFEHSRREEVIQHIYEKYNERHAAMVCTVVRYRSRMAIRETAKVFGIPLAKINEMIKFMGRDGFSRLLEPASAERFGLPQDQWKMFLHLAHQLRGFPRHLGIHTGGFLITQDPITEMVPVEKATMNGRYVIQWNKDDVALLKLMKIDVLSLGMLTCLRKCFDLLKNHKGLHFNLATLPSEDPATYEMIGKADTVGVFQIESRAQMQTLPRMKPVNFYDLVVEVALVRPGPLQGGMVHPYLRRRQGLEKVTYAHKLLEPILKKTHGVPIFQEQVMKMVIAAADFSPGEADELRRIMSSAWRKQSTMDGIKKRILDGFAKHGITYEYGEQIYKTIEGFANYGFPESHAASFALLTYASCYIKKHHPDVFACALLNSQPMGFYAPRTLVAEAQRHGVEVRPLCIQHSDYDYSLEEIREKQHALRVGLRSLYGVPEVLLRRIEESRKTQGAFKDIADFIHRTELPRSALIKVAASGALECFNTNVRELIWHLESLSLDQESFLWGHPKEQFSFEDEEDSDAEHLPFESNWDRLRREYDSKGYSVDSHPLSVLRSYLKSKNQEFISKRYVPYFNSGDLPRMKSKTKVRLAGLVSVTQRPPTAKGMCFITLEDEFGFMNIVIHPDVYQKDRLAIYGKSLLEIQGQVEKVGDLINIRAARVLPLI
ncbi:error-prone DNA polymerase [Bdellovibrio sp. HCB-110]|uniref:error-prone DNA polymerase n=1 Tax=Bdellovibrio sp. HCB-110 TaxID=3391182 RepID=UPI0039B44B10